MYISLEEIVGIAVIAGLVITIIILAVYICVKRLCTGGYSSPRPVYEAKYYQVDFEVPPDEFTCPISLDVMKDPVVCADGHTYERESISKWLKKQRRSPKTGQVIDHLMLVPNWNLKSLIYSQAAVTAAGGATNADAECRSKSADYV
jgi:hypothetical protein